MGGGGGGGPLVVSDKSPSIPRRHNSRVQTMLRPRHKTQYEMDISIQTILPQIDISMLTPCYIWVLVYIYICAIQRHIHIY